MLLQHLLGHVAGFLLGQPHFQVVLPLLKASNTYYVEVTVVGRKMDARRRVEGAVDTRPRALWGLVSARTCAALTPPET